MAANIPAEVQDAQCSGCLHEKGSKRGWRQLAAPRASLDIPYRTCAKTHNLDYSPFKKQVAIGLWQPRASAQQHWQNWSASHHRRRTPGASAGARNRVVLVGGRRLLAAQEKANTWPSLTSLMCRNLIVETGKFRSLEFIVLLRSSFFLAHAFA